MYGTASSLIVPDGLLVFCNDNKRESCLEAINPATGKTVWRKDRPELKYNWNTTTCGEPKHVTIFNPRTVQQLDRPEGRAASART